MVNKTDETIELEPGESMELGIKMVGDELRLEELPGERDDVDSDAYHIRNARRVVREYVNATLNDDATFHDEGEPILEVDGEPLTRRHVDEALTELLES